MINLDTLLRNSFRGNFTRRYDSTAPAEKPAAVMILLRQRMDVWEVCFTRRSELLADHRGQIAFPGGRAETVDAGPLQTALRETCEEVGIAPDAVLPLGILDSVETSSGFRVWPVVGVIRMPVEPRPSSPEVTETFWIPLEWLAADGRWEWRTVNTDENHNTEKNDPSHVIASLPELALSGVKGSPATASQINPRPDGKRKAIFFEAYQGHILWGATAMIMVQLLDRLHKGGAK